MVKLASELPILEHSLDRDIFQDLFYYYLEKMGLIDSQLWYEGFENETFQIHAFWWGGCTCGFSHEIGFDDMTSPAEHTVECMIYKPNFVYKPTNFILDWYKYPLRGNSCNRVMTEGEFEGMMMDCLQSVLKVYKWGLPHQCMVDISKLREGFKRVYVNGEVESVSAPREVTIKATGAKNTVTDVVLKDATGSITLSLWNEQGKMVKTGSKVKVENGFVTAFKGKNQLSLGKFGKLAVLEF